MPCSTCISSSFEVLVNCILPLLQLLPLLELLYCAPRRTHNQIYMLLIILLILSQDSSFNANVHKIVSARSKVTVALWWFLHFNLDRLEVRSKNLEWYCWWPDAMTFWLWIPWYPCNDGLGSSSLLRMAAWSCLLCRVSGGGGRKTWTGCQYQHTVLPILGMLPLRMEWFLCATKTWQILQLQENKWNAVVHFPTSRSYRVSTAWHTSYHQPLHMILSVTNLT